MITDDGDGLALALARALIQEGRSVVLLRFPASVIGKETLPIPSDIKHVTLDTMDEAHLVEQFAAITDTYGSVGALVHVHPIWKHESLGSDMVNRASETILSHVFLMAKHLKSSLTTAVREGRSCFMTVTRMDGALGLSQRPRAFEVTSGLAAGGLSGLVKTLNREWSVSTGGNGVFCHGNGVFCHGNGVFCRMVDLAPDLDRTQATEAVLAELHDPNRLLLEVGYGPSGRVTLEAVAEDNGGGQV